MVKEAVAESKSRFGNDQELQLSIVSSGNFFYNFAKKASL